MYKSVRVNSPILQNRSDFFGIVHPDISSLIEGPDHATKKTKEPIRAFHSALLHSREKWHRTALFKQRAPRYFFSENWFFFFLMLSEWSLCETLTPHYTHRPAQAQVCFKILSKKPKKCILTDFDSFWGFFDHFWAQRLYCKALYLSNIFHPTLQLIFMADIDQKNQN